MFKVPIDKIIPVTSARARISSLVKKINENGSMYVLTRGGKPAAVLASIEMFERSQKGLDEEDKNATKEIEKSSPRVETKEKPMMMENVQNDDNLSSNTENVQKDVQAVEDDSSLASTKADDDVTEDTSDEQPVKISIN